GFFGYFFTPNVMYSLVRQIVNHTIQNLEPVQYWAIGNEVPLNSTAAAAFYGKLINTAIAGIHVRLPNALVGTDDMLTTPYFDYFTKNTPKIGYLGFHWYQSWGICVDQFGNYCPPRGQPQGTPT